MDSLDFLSSSPTFSIFQKKTNSIKFGGILFLCYLIIMIFICVIYIVDYIINEKYDIQCSYSFKFRERNNKNDERELNKLPDIPINFLIDINYFNHEYYKKDFLDKNRLVIKNNKGEYIKIGPFLSFDITREISDLENEYYEVIYKCRKNNCSDFYINNNYYLEVYLTEFYIDHYASIPIQLKYNHYISEINERFDENKLLFLSLSWSYIIYKDIKGISRLFDRFFDFQNEYNNGYVNSYNFYSFQRYYSDSNKTELVIAKISNNIAKSYIEYRRKEISFMDILAKIGALFSTFHFIFITIFKLYENNFNNYKIINKIIHQYYSNNKVNYLMNKELKIGKDIQNHKNIDNWGIPLLPINDDNQEAENEEIIDKKKEVYTNLKNKESVEGKNDDEEKEITNLPKISFFNYFFNNIYCPNFIKSQKQELINICNKLVLKYTSIDYLLLNQIKLENLLNDYKWNNPSLNDIKNNELISQLKNYILINKII